MPGNTSSKPGSPMSIAQLVYRAGFEKHEVSLHLQGDDMCEIFVPVGMEHTGCRIVDLACMIKAYRVASRVRVFTADIDTEPISVR